MIKPTRVAFVTVLVRDLGAALKWYAEMLGFEKREEMATAHCRARRQIKPSTIAAIGLRPAGIHAVSDFIPGSQVAGFTSRKAFIIGLILTVVGFWRRRYSHFYSHFGSSRFGQSARSP